MNRFAKTAVALFGGILGAMCLSAQTADIGRLTLTAPNFGYQTVGLYNYTGATNGCNQLSAQYNVCNAVNITSWQLKVEFTANVAGVPASPLIFTSNGTGDVVGPTNSNFDAYTGEAGNPWALSFDLTNAACAPNCDAQISKITFTGTIDATTLNLYNGSVSGPFILDSLSTQSFTIVWTIPSTDYTTTPDTLFDATDLIISNQTQSPPAAQTINFTALSDQTLASSPPPLSATATSGLAVSFASNSTAVCTVSATTINLVSAGICSITATQPGNANFAAAPPVTQTFNVTLAPQTISFAPLSNAALGSGPITLTATASSGLAVALASTTLPVCTISGNVLTLISGGSCSITATQTGNAVFAAATPVVQAFTVSVGGQTISFGPLSDVVFGATPAALSATASSGLTVAFASTTTAICTVSGTTITLLSAGSCSITATQPGNANFGAATPVVQAFNVTQAPQTISFSAISDVPFSASTNTLSATATSGLTVAFASTTQSVCTVSGTTLTLVTVGACSITASQPGNTNYAAATPVIRGFNITQAAQTISFSALSNVAFGSAPFTVSATATSGLAVTFGSTTTSVCTVSGSTVTILAGGACSITADQSGNANYSAATQVLQGFTVTAATQTISFSALSNVAFGSAPFTLSATATSGLTVAFASTTTGVCTVAGTAVTILAGGACSITATQPGNANYAAATPVVQGFTVTPITQTISFSALSNVAFGSAPFTVGATATSGLTVAFASTTTVVCTVSGTTVTILAGGACSITATQPGNASYNVATPVVQSFTVTPIAQTISFGPLTNVAFASAPFALSATATSGLTVGFASTTTLICTVSGTTVTILAGGACSITATQAGNASYNAATPVVQGFTVTPGSQTISFSALSNTGFGSAPFSLSATATSGLAVAFASTTTSICTVSGNTVSVLAVGACSITATQTGNTNYAAATPVVQGFSVTQGSQTISFSSLSNVAFGSAPFTVGATATSGLTVTFASTTTGICTVSGNTVTILTGGACSITASQAGNTNYAAAPPVSQGFTVTPAAQSISFGALSNVAFGSAPFTVSATATSGLTVSFASNTTAVCTVSGTTVTLLAGGACSITASQSGNGNYAAATPVTQGFTVTPVAQTISFGALSNVAFGGAPFTVSATASSGLAVSFGSNTTSVCTVSGNTVTLVGAGSCSVTASQSGNASYAAATPVTQSFTVTQASQTISFGALGNVALGSAPFAIGATASSGLVVSFSSTTLGVCTVSGNIVTVLTTGTCSITASQSGNATYTAATPVTQSFTVAVGAQTISFGALSNVVFGTAPFSVSASASSGLAVTFSASGACTISGSIVTITAAGSCSITAFQSGNANVGPAAPVTQSFTVSQASQTITFGTLSNVTLPASPFTISASATSGLTVTFVSTTTSVCTVSGNTVTPLAAGSCSITASQPGNTNYLAATPVARSFTINGQGGAPVFTASPQQFTFNYQQGSATLPAPQGLSVFSQPSGVSYTTSATSTGNWLSASAGSSTPGSVSVSVNVAGLAPATYLGTVTIASGASASVVVPVTLIVAPSIPPVLTVSPATYTISAFQGGQSSHGLVTVQNSGGGTLQFNAQAVSTPAWLQLSAATSGSATPSSPVSLPFTIDPTNLPVGTFTGQIVVSDVNSAATGTMTVVLSVVSPGSPEIDLSSDGLNFTAVAGSGAPPAQSFYIANYGAGTLNWTAKTSTLSGGSWLSATPGSGTLAVGQVGGNVSVSINNAGLAAGQYYGTVTISDPNASDNPQSVSIALTVLAAPAGSSVTALSTGLLLIGPAGRSTPAAQTITFSNSSSAPIGYTSSVFTPGLTGWLSTVPSSGSVAPGLSTIQFAADLTKFSGLQFGTVTVSFADGGTATVQVIGLALPGGGSILPGGTAPAISSLQPRAVATCAAGKAGFLIPVFRKPGDHSAAQVAVATTVQMQVIDDCGSSVTAASGGSVQVSFSNGDHTISLHDIGGGVWEGTWTPANAAASVTLQVVASEGSLTLNPAAGLPNSISAAVSALNATSAPQPTGIANAASAGKATPQVVAPGSYIAIYGTGLAAAGNPNATSLPLQTTLNGAQVLLGGQPLPLLYAASGQVNALVPQGIAPNATYPLVIVRGGTSQSVPVPVTVTQLQPGTYTVDTSGSGPGIVTNAITGALINASNPAHAQDYLVVYMSGLGAVVGPNGETQPGDGAVAPLTTIFHTKATVTATIGGVTTPVQFSGLTPTLSALYQVNIQVPAGVKAGTAVPVVITATDPVTKATAQSNSVLIVVQ